MHHTTPHKHKYRHKRAASTDGAGRTDRSLSEHRASGEIHLDWTSNLARGGGRTYLICHLVRVRVRVVLATYTPFYYYYYYHTPAQPASRTFPGSGFRDWRQVLLLCIVCVCVCVCGAPCQQNPLPSSSSSSLFFFSHFPTLGIYHALSSPPLFTGSIHILRYRKITTATTTATNPHTFTVATTAHPTDLEPPTHLGPIIEDSLGHKTWHNTTDYIASDWKTQSVHQHNEYHKEDRSRLPMGRREDGCRGKD